MNNIMMCLKDAIAARLNEIIEEKQMSQYQVSMLSGVPQSTLSTPLFLFVATIMIILWRYVSLFSVRQVSFVLLKRPLF